MSTQIEVIGGVRAVVSGEPVRLRRQVQRLVAILVAAGPSGIEASALAEELWLGNPPARWNPAIRNAVTALRQATQADIVTTSAGRYALSCATDDVDAWRLLAVASSPDLDLRRVGRIGRFLPFDGLELTPLLRRMTETLHGARVQLVDRVDRPSDIDAEMLASLVAAVRDDPFAEPIAIAAISLLRRLDRQQLADELLDHIDLAHTAELGSPTPPAIASLRTDPASADQPTADRAGSSSGAEVRSLPSIVADLTQQPMTDRRRRLAAQLADDIAHQRARPRIAIVAPAGSGKSRFVTEVARKLHDAGNTVLYAVAIGEETTAYGALLTASPLFRRRFLEVDAADEASVWALWSSVIDELSNKARPITIVVDDAQWLDRNSVRLLGFMHRMEGSIPFTTIVAGRPNSGEPDWTSFEAELLDDPRTQQFDLPDLDLDELTDLVRTRWPNRSEAVYRDVASELLDASGGLPMPAILLIDSLTGPTLQRHPRPPGRHLDLAVDRLRQLDPVTQDVVAAASVIATNFSMDDVTRLLDHEPAAIEAALDNAVRAGVLADRETPETFRFEHDLLRTAATTLVDRDTVARWSATHSGHVEDPVRLAQLALAGQSALDPLLVAERTVIGAEHALERGLLRLAIALSESCRSIVDTLDRVATPEGPAPASLEHRALACLTAAQLRLGALDEAASTRQLMLDRMTSADDHVRANRVLIRSVAIVEVDQPTSIRVVDLDRVDPTALDDGLRFERCLAIARLATWKGDTARRDRELDAAQTLVRSSDDAARLFYAQWRCGAHTVDPTWFADVATRIDQAEDGQAVADLELCRSLEFGAQARWDEADRSANSICNSPVASAEQQWLAKLARFAFAAGQGDLEAATERADEAHAHGLLYDLPLATVARAAQSFTIASCRGSLPDWLAAMEPHEELLRATLAIAALGRARFEAGRVDEAWQTVEPIIEEVLSGQPRLASSTAAVIAPLLRRKAPPSVRQRAIDLVRAQGERWLITASGVGVHGPATRTLAILEGDRRALLAVRRKLEATPLWVEVIDRDIARLDQER